jgi:threonine dehydratase
VKDLETAAYADGVGNFGAILDAATIRATLARIPAEFRASPQFLSESLAAVTGRPVVVKVESVNPVGAFKGRGAWLAVEELTRGGALPPAGIVVASTGNFGQSIAYAGRAMGVPVTVFADLDANPVKLSRIREFGATVCLEGSDFDEARVAADRHAVETGARLLIDGADPWIAVGAGTLALELTDAIESGALPALAAAYVPVGNGALIAGIGTWLKSAAPGCRVVGVQSDAAPSMTLSWRAGRPIETRTAATRAGGIATRVPVPEALEMMSGVVDDVVLVSEAAISEAQPILRAATGVTVELAAAASLAAALSKVPDAPGAVMVLVTGSNAEPGL